MADVLSDYELKRLETIRQNQLLFDSLGLGAAVAAVRDVPKKPKAPKAPKPTVMPTMQRSSRRLSGDVAPLEGLEASDDDDLQAYRDPNDVSQMLPAELAVWCKELREHALETATEQLVLDAEQAQRLQSAQVWLQPFTEFTARFGGNKESTMSKANVKLVLKQTFKLVSGAGVTTPLRDGVFAQGRPITLGITSAEVDALRVEAQLWCPLKTAPEDIVGKVAADGSVVPRKPPTSGPGSKLDTSNGWLLNHPLVKVRKYCEHLDEVREKGLERTMRRLMTGSEDAPAEAERDEVSSGVAGGGGGGGSPAARESRIAIEDFIVADGEGEDDEDAHGGKRKPKAKAGKKLSAAAVAAAGVAAAGAAHEKEDEDDEEDVPLAKRPRSKQQQQPSPSATAASPFPPALHQVPSPAESAASTAAAPKASPQGPEKTKAAEAEANAALVGREVLVPAKVFGEALTARVDKVKGGGRLDLYFPSDHSVVEVAAAKVRKWLAAKE